MGAEFDSRTGALLDAASDRDVPINPAAHGEPTEEGRLIEGRRVSLPWGRSEFSEALVVGEVVVVNDPDHGLVVVGADGQVLARVELDGEPDYDPSPVAATSSSVVGVLADGRLFEVRL